MALTTNLINYWKLDGNSNDAVGSNNGTDTSITYNAGNGIIGQGAGFGGASHIDLGTLAITGTGDRSVSLWVKCSNSSGTPYIFTISRSGASVTGEVMIWMEPTGKMHFFDYDGGASGFDSLTNSTVFNNGSWHHYVFVKSGTAGAVYVDGVLDSSPTAASNVNWSSLGSAFGYDNRSGVNLLTGAMDEVGLWTRALTSLEVTQLYNGGAGLAYPLVPSSTLPPARFVRQAVMRAATI